MEILGDDDSNLKQQICEVFHSQDVVDPFDGLKTEHLQKMFFKEEFHLVVNIFSVQCGHVVYMYNVCVCVSYMYMYFWQEPVERKLGHRVITTTRNSRPFFRTIWDYVYDIPLLQSLQQLLSDCFILKEVFSNVEFHTRIHHLYKPLCVPSLFSTSVHMC